MSRIRSIHPGLWTDEEFVTLSPLARLFYIGIWGEADDKGIFVWSPLQLKMRLLPADNADTGALLTELEAAGRVLRFTAGGKAYGAIRNFNRFQRPKSPNDLHPTTPSADQFTRDAGAYNSSFGRTPSPSVPNSFPTAGEIPPQMEDGGGRRKDGEEENLSSPIGNSSSPCGADTPAPAFQLVLQEPGFASALTPEHIVEAWNAMADRSFGGKRKVAKLNPKRRKAINALIADFEIDAFLQALRAIEQSDFLRSGKDTWPGADFDFFLRPDKFLKLVEGAYEPQSAAA